MPFMKRLTLSDIIKLYADKYSGGHTGHKVKCYIESGIRQMAVTGEITRIYISYNKYEYVRTYGPTIKT